MNKRKLITIIKNTDTTSTCSHLKVYQILDKEKVRYEYTPYKIQEGGMKNDATLSNMQ